MSDYGKINNNTDGTKSVRFDYQDGSYVEITAYPDDYEPRSEFDKKHAATIRKQYYPKDQIFEKKNTGALQCAVGPKDSQGVWKTSGFTVEELLIAAHLRLALFQDKFPCDENAGAIGCITTALMGLELRRRDRAERKVLNKNEK